MFDVQEATDRMHLLGRRPAEGQAEEARDRCPGAAGPNPARHHIRLADRLRRGCSRVAEEDPPQSNRPRRRGATVRRAVSGQRYFGRLSKVSGKRCQAISRIQRLGRFLSFPRPTVLPLRGRKTKLTFPMGRLLTYTRQTTCRLNNWSEPGLRNTSIVVSPCSTSFTSTTSTTYSIACTGPNPMTRSTLLRYAKSVPWPRWGASTMATTYQCLSWKRYTAPLPST